MTYKDVINDIHVEVNQPAEMSKISDEFLVASIHKYCQILSERSFIEDRVEIELEEDVGEYELPDKSFEIKKVKYAALIVGDDKYEVEIVDAEHFLDYERRSVTWHGTTAPKIAMFWKEDNQGFIKVAPPPGDEDEQKLVLYIGVLYHTHKLNELYTSLEQDILFPAKYLDTLKWGVKQDIYGILKQYDLQNQAMRLFDSSLVSNNVNRGVYHKIKVTFT